MSTEAVPPGLWERIRNIVREEVGKLLKSGLLRNASISDGGLTIKGGFLRLLAGLAGVELFYVGPVNPALPDGTPQQGWRVRRADGTTVLVLRDAFPGSDGTLNQALTWLDRGGHIVLSDDTDSGQGIARPWLPLVAYPSDSADWPTTGSTSFVTKYRVRGTKQQPRLWVETWAGADAAGAVAEVQVLVNGDVWTAPQSSTPGFVSGLNFGPATVPGSHMSDLVVEVQVRLKSGTGLVRVGVGRVEGRQS